MSLGILNLQGGNIGQHMTGDIITPSEKNMENWGESGNPSVVFGSGVNTVTYENNPKPMFNDILYARAGVRLADSSLATVISFMSEHPTYLAAYLTFQGQLYLEVGSPSSISGNTIVYSYTREYVCSIYNGIATISTTSDRTNQTFNGNGQIGTYEDIGDGGSGAFTGYIAQDFAVEDGKSYYVNLLAYSTTGFTASSSNNIVLTSGSNSANMTLDSNADTDYKNYSTVITADGDTLNFKFDLSTMSSSADIVLKITSIEIFKLGS